MDIRERVFWLAGGNFFQRKQSVENIKNNILRKQPALLNVSVFHSKDLDLNILRDGVLNLSFDKEKVIIFKNANALSKEIRRFLFEKMEKIISFSYIILEFEEDLWHLQRDKKVNSDDFFNFVLKKGKGFKFPFRQREVSLEDFKKSMRRKDLNSAVYFLEELFKSSDKRELGPLILGVLISEAVYSRNSEEKQKHFSYFWDTDRTIKSKGIDTKLALEILITKLLS